MPDVTKLINDPRFQALPPDRKRLLLEKIGTPEALTPPKAPDSTEVSPPDIPQLRPAEEPDWKDAVAGALSDFRIRGPEVREAREAGIGTHPMGRELYPLAAMVGLGPPMLAAAEAAPIKFMLDMVLGTAAGHAAYGPAQRKGEEIVPGLGDVTGTAAELAAFAVPGAAIHGGSRLASNIAAKRAGPRQLELPMGDTIPTTSPLPPEPRGAVTSPEAASPSPGRNGGLLDSLRATIIKYMPEIEKFGWEMMGRKVLGALNFPGAVLFGGRLGKIGQQIAQEEAAKRSGQQLASAGRGAIADIAHPSTPTRVAAAPEGFAESDVAQVMKALGKTRDEVIALMQDPRFAITEKPNLPILSQTPAPPRGVTPPRSNRGARPPVDDIPPPTSSPAPEAPAAAPAPGGQRPAPLSPEGIAARRGVPAPSSTPPKDFMGWMQEQGYEAYKPEKGKWYWKDKNGQRVSRAKERDLEAEFEINKGEGELRSAMGRDVETGKPPEETPPPKAEGAPAEPPATVAAAEPVAEPKPAGPLSPEAATQRRVGRKPMKGAFGKLADRILGPETPVSESRRGFLGNAPKAAVGAASAASTAVKGEGGTLAERVLKGTITESEQKILDKVAANAADMEDVSILTESVEGLNKLPEKDRIRVITDLWYGRGETPDEYLIGDLLKGTLDELDSEAIIEGAAKLGVDRNTLNDAVDLAFNYMSPEVKAAAERSIGTIFGKVVKAGKNDVLGEVTGGANTGTFTGKPVEAPKPGTPTPQPQPQTAPKVELPPAAEPKLPTVESLPPVPEGHTRYYGGGDSGWMSTIPERGGSYGTKGRYLDVPNEKVADLHAAAQKSGQPRPDDILVPDEMYKGAKDVELPVTVHEGEALPEAESDALLKELGVTRTTEWPPKAEPEPPTAPVAEASEPGRRRFLKKAGKGAAGAAVGGKAPTTPTKAPKEVDPVEALKKYLGKEASERYGADRGMNADYGESMDQVGEILNAISKGKTTIEDGWTGDEIPIKDAIAQLKRYATNWQKLPADEIEAGDTTSIKEMRDVLRALEKDPNAVLEAWKTVTKDVENLGSHAQDVLEDMDFFEVLEPVTRALGRAPSPPAKPAPKPETPPATPPEPKEPPVVKPIAQKAPKPRESERVGLNEKRHSVYTPEGNTEQWSDADLIAKIKAGEWPAAGIRGAESKKAAEEAGLIVRKTSDTPGGTPQYVTARTDAEIDAAINSKAGRGFFPEKYWMAYENKPSKPIRPIAQRAKARTPEPRPEDFKPVKDPITGRTKLPERPSGPEIKRKPIESSAFRSWGYDTKTKTLEVEHIDGSIYRYHDVPPMEIPVIQKAKSKGKALGDIARRYKATRQGTTGAEVLKARKPDGSVGPYDNMKPEEQLDHVIKGDKPAFFESGLESRIAKYEARAKRGKLVYKKVENGVNSEGEKLYLFFAAKDKPRLDALLEARTGGGPIDHEAVGKALGYTDKDIKAYKDRSKALEESGEKEIFKALLEGKYKEGDILPNGEKFLGFDEEGSPIVEATKETWGKWHKK